ncbi:alpha/beta hydrolase [Glaciimonas sp. Gout2]|uniref:alpha/beta fold hydrolase n=2 Tax=Glaciimonas TaxID=1229970 RepID=UPI002AB4DA83|nr:MULTISPECIES: alpha/beta hydrolase [unclassified Glaciimonas]MDY7544761.1 alpha/beta hydrolase [Glaciimonas sp. CA11.2]MEB0011941.1 alpha/beta hydrolase [Glaciimonas sp. Cout2]MEB0082824.1 alpha/beta hydrolase [Glaciimonas sp. Gout2]
MTSALHKTVQCISPAGLHAMAYQEWGDPHNPNVLLCLHGVTRVSDDFDQLARNMCDTYRVVCPDVVGRGRSGRLRNPQYYVVPQYVSDMVTLLARLNADTVDLVGTSMGGLIGLGLASLPDNPIRKLVLNDVGPHLNPDALTRIAAYIGADMRFPTFDAGAAYIKSISLPFGEHTDVEWHKLAADVLRQNAAGEWVRHYDLGLAVPFATSTADNYKAAEVMLWAAYDAIQCPTLLIRGDQSDLLSHEVALSMTQRGPKAKLVEFAGVGHAPTLLHADQIAVISDFLFGQEA